MKMVKSKRNLLLSTLVAILCFCCIGIFSAHGNKTVAKAETTSSVTIKAVPNSASATLDYVYIYFEGFNTKVNYDEPAPNDYVLHNVLVNGVSIYDINASTDVSGWSWDIFPQTEQPKYRKPVITYIGTTGSTNKYCELRFHKNVYDTFVAKDGYFIITVKEGFTVNGYVIDKETSFTRILNSAGEIEYVNSESAVSVDWRGSYDGSASMDYMYLHFAGFTTKDDYKGNANSDYVFQNILLNGRSIYDINTTTDVTGWEWNTFPQNEASLPQYKKPVIGYIKDTNGRIQLRIHKNLSNSLLAKDGYVRISMRKGFVLNGYVVGESNEFELMSVTPGTVSVDTWNPYPGASNLYYAYLHFEGFNVQDDYSGESNGDYVLQNININGRSIYDINKTTDVSGWTWEIFPQTADAKYHKAILTYTDGTGRLQLRIHKNFYNSIIAEYGAFEISLNAGFMLNGYINKNEVKLVKNANDVFVAPTVIDANTVSVSRWQPLSHVKLSYFDIKYSAFPQLDYQMMDVASYAYIGNMIAINGVKMSDINKNTNVSGYEWLQFPSTAAAVYQKPFVTLINAGSMEVRMHDNYLQSIQEDGLKISLLPGYYINNGGLMCVLDREVTFTKDPTVTEYVATGGFFATAEQENFEMIDGASIRMINESGGIRFTAKVSKEYLDGLVASGSTYKLMMQVNRENSDKTAYLECNNQYEKDGFIYYSVAIVNLKTGSYALTYTARPYIDITTGGQTQSLYTESICMSRKISDVAYMAYTDISETYDEVKYPHEVLWEGRTQYSPYTQGQRDIIAGYIIDGVITADGIYKFENESDKNFLMKSDNEEVNAFFEEYADRFVYYYKNFESTDDYVTDTVVGNASTSWKDWEAESILFMSSLHLNGNDDQLSGSIADINVDKYGYVWEGDSFFGQGWNNPTYLGSRADTSDPFLSDGWEFVAGRKNSSILAIDSGATGAWGPCEADWTATGDGTFASATDDQTNNGAGYFLGHGQNSTYMTFSVESSAYNGVLQAAHSPFVEIGLIWSLSAGNFNEIYLDFKTSGSYVSLPLSTWATTEIDFTKAVNEIHVYVPVFEHANWTGTVTGLRIRATGNFTGYCHLDYVRGCYDTRMIDCNTSFISAGRQHFENTGDIAFLTANITNYRKALLFLTNYMADNGLINLSNFIGHNGSAQGFGSSLISTYWDIVSLAPNSSYVNALYYEALLNMAYLEDAMTCNNISVAMPSVKLTLTGADVVYSYTSSQLRAMAENVKSLVSAYLNESTKTGYFKTFTVEIEGQTRQAGRFIEGYCQGNQLDFGAVALNLMILETGVATEEQKELVMTWIASIDDLYDYVFAPKTNTEDLGDQYCWGYAAADYGVSCQNGGAILFVSYYDLLARAQVFGIENAYQRLTEIMAWFNDVKVAFENSGRSDASEFFIPYYETHEGTLQGKGEEGALGLHAEFIENAILYASVPNLFFGLDTYYNANGLVMKVAPNLPDEIGTWKMEQLRYAGLTCDIAIGNSFVVICNVEELDDGALERNTQVEVTLTYTGETPSVFVNNKLITEGYVVDTVNKTVTVTVDFANVNVSVR